jgi:hypothetical protein
MFAPVSRVVFPSLSLALCPLAEEEEEEEVSLLEALLIRPG